MREILFRGKRLDNGKWIEGNLIYIDDGHIGIMPMDSQCWPWVYPATIGQYVGINDSLLARIYEGDIVRHCYDYLEIEEGEEDTNSWTISTVSWQGNNDYPAFDIDDHDREYNLLSEYTATRDVRVEVIGNVYDAPEVLKEV